ncbi:MAG: hypothetical protein WBQ25_13200 [Nitrososphaeraceae archaeon]
MAKFIAELVFDDLNSNIRECIRIARLADNNIAKAQRIADMLTTYSNRGEKL